MIKNESKTVDDLTIAVPMEHCSKKKIWSRNWKKIIYDAVETSVEKVRRDRRPTPDITDLLDWSPKVSYKL